MATLSPEVRAAINQASDRAARKVAKEVLLNIGLDTTSGEAMLDHQKDMALIRRLRLASEAKSIKIWVAVFAAALSLANTLLVLAIQRLLGA